MPKILKTQGFEARLSLKQGEKTREPKKWHQALTAVTPESR